LSDSLSAQHGKSAGSRPELDMPARTYRVLFLVQSVDSDTATTAAEASQEPVAPADAAPNEP
jgi:hypothetical protein